MTNAVVHVEGARISWAGGDVPQTLRSVGGSQLYNHGGVKWDEFDKMEAVWSIPGIYKQCWVYK